MKEQRAENREQRADSKEQRSALDHFLEPVAGVILSIPNSYSTILFSDSSLLGLVMLGVTFISPIIGLAGLIGLITAILVSRLMGFNVWESRSGIITFNSLITSLAVGYYYPGALLAHSPITFWLFVVISSSFALFLYVGLNYITYTYLKIPSMSLAFSITTLILWFFFVKNGFLSNFPDPKQALSLPQIEVPRFWELYFISLGSILFMPYTLAGMLMAGVLFLISRIGFLLSLLGWSICYLLVSRLSTASSGVMFFPGFNLILISLAIGGIYLIPSFSAWVIAIIASVIGYYLSLAFSSSYTLINPYTGFATSLSVPIFAFPLNFVIILVIFVLRLRLVNKSPVINDLGIYNAEKALETYMGNYQRFAGDRLAQFCLPVNGDWLITQGLHGAHTHKYDWAYAWDFEIEDVHGKRYSADPAKLVDYYAFNKPVFASAAGWVVKVLDGIPDNKIGEINTTHNWGNYITVSHGYGLYTLYAHLKNGSVQVRQGDYVSIGSKIGFVGNSGRSPLPHLHFQAQQGIEPGSKTVKCQFVNYKLLQPEGDITFVSSGIPKEGEKISPYNIENKVQTLLNLNNLNEQHFQVLSGDNKKAIDEKWRVDLDLMGMFHINSSSGVTLDFSIVYGIYNTLGIKGNKRSALNAFAFALSRFPYIEKHSVRWTDNPSPSVAFNPLLKQLLLLISPVFNPYKVRVSSESKEVSGTITISSTTKYYFVGIGVKTYATELVIETRTGIKTILLTKNGRQVIRAHRALHQNEPVELHGVN